MRALPGRTSRANLSEPVARVTRSATKPDQRRRILRATAELVAKRGYAATTVELIVKRARVSYKTFYSHFRSKEDCYLALIDSVAAGVQRRVVATLAAEERPWPEQVIAALTTLCELVLSDPMVARACIVEGPTAGPAVFDRYLATSKALAPLFRAGRNFNPASAELPETIEETLAGSVLWSAYQRLVVGEDDQLPELLPELIQLVLRPYLGDRAAARYAREADALSVA